MQVASESHTAHPAAMLALWEATLGQRATRRDDALLVHGLGLRAAPRRLGARNAGLLALQTRLFGPALALRAECPRCAEALTFGIDAEQCRAACVGSEHEDASTHVLDAQGYLLHYRLPTADDLALIEGEADLDAAAARLLSRCVVTCEQAGRAADTAALPAAVRQQLAAAMESQDPGASLWFSLQCPACTHAWDAPLDAGAALWQQLQAQAERLLLQVDALARRYGWTESEVLALSPARRAAYLQLIDA
jgi:hypothetical protein